MSHNTAWDSLEFEKLDFPYNRIEAELSGEPRFIRGNNSLITFGGKLTKRPGNTLLTGSNVVNRRIDRTWIYETLESPPKVYIVASMYNPTLTTWELQYIYLSAVSPTWTVFPTLRSCNSSTRPHESIVSRGLLFVKGYPSAASGEKLGTIMFDGSGSGTPSVKFWGILPPTTPAALVGQITTTTSSITATGLTLNVASDPGFPVAPFNVQCDFETMTVTNKGGGLNWTVTRAVNGTTAVAHDTAQIVIYRNWSTSAHQVTVNVYWRYSYAYKTSTGQISNRAPIQTNLDKLPSSTGPFLDMIPKFTMQGNADTTNVPKLVVLRTLDGGGTYYKVEEITNTGGTITYSDTNYESGTAGGTFSDPIPDTVLNTGTLGTTLVSNSPPPTVIDPLVVGTDTPAASSPLAAYASRIWLGVGNILFFSGAEEVTLGIQEECWPSGFNGNFFRFQYPITNIQATTNALYIFTLQATYELSGTNRETFNVRPIFDNLGHPYGHPRAICRYEDTVFFLTHDFRIAQIQDSQLTVVSDALFTDLVDAMNLGSEFDIKYWGDLEKSWIVVTGHRTSDTTASKQWILDLKKSKTLGSAFWNTPWTIRCTATVSGRMNDTSPQRRLIFAMFDQTTNNSCLVRMDPTGRTGADYFVTANTGFTFDVVTNLFKVPAGNHVNKLRLPGVTPTVYGISLDRLVFSGDSDPTIYYYADDLWSDPINPANGPEDPARRGFSKQYTTMMWGVHEVSQRMAVEISKLATQELFESMNLLILWNPDSGA